MFPLHQCRPLGCPRRDFPLLQFPQLALAHHPRPLGEFRDLPLLEWDSVAPQGEEGVLVDSEEVVEDGK